MTRKPSAEKLPRVLSRDEHVVSRKQISDNALKVMHRLRSGGFDAFLVGGGVRDLMLGKQPKDFDIATDATPEEVRQLFRNSRIIGRRFKIVHVRFGREIIEVTTYRGSHEDGNAKSAVAGESGMLLRDNVYGTLEEDAIRRDFTVNALYYCSDKFTVHDYVGGLSDLEKREVRIIGDASSRYQEDPVRMLRAVRFAAKLDFTLEKRTAAPLQQLAPLLEQIPAARLFDEVLKLFMEGQALRVYALLKHYNLFRPLFPATQAVLDSGDSSASALIEQGLINTDTRIGQNKPVTPAFIFAIMLWPVVRREMAQLQAEGMPEIPALHQAAQNVVSAQQAHTSIPKRFSMPMRDIWELQLRLPRRTGRRAQELLEHRYFRAGYDFLLLREQSGEIPEELGPWWTAFQEADESARDGMQKKVAGDRSSRGNGRRRRKPRHRKSPRPS
ncbi:poly(A) polymerase [Litorivivens lipolytica]|uniref:Poly(A) polymerase I n=1 Tax=Litorivivens lipolytica TaxID=1524264 RepID=A0A7W4Z4Y1_9GAMM|nr:poly(A) polymerase [Litorivivens lipolytica]